MNYIVDDIKTVVDLVREEFLTLDSTQVLINNGAIQLDGTGAPPYYMYGHRLEIANRLKEKGKDAIEKLRKYPLIALRLDTTERIQGNTISYNLNIAIVHETKIKYNAEERYENVFKPILYPLYELFFTKLKESGLFWWGNTGLEKPAHTKIDRPFFGIQTAEKNTKHIFADPLDAIEILDLRLTQKVKTC